MTFDYTASAELFMPKKGKAGLRRPLSYRRFASAAEAIRCATSLRPRNVRPITTIDKIGLRLSRAALSGSEARPARGAASSLTCDHPGLHRQ